MAEPNFSNDIRNPRGRPRGRGISHFLNLIGDETTNQIPGCEGKSKKEIIARKIIAIALDEKTSTKEFLMIATEIMDRLEGKPVNTNLNADVSTNPFEGISTEKLEALKEKLKAIQDKP